MRMKGELSLDVVIRKRAGPLNGWPAKIIRRSDVGIAGDGFRHHQNGAVGNVGAGDQEKDDLAHAGVFPRVNSVELL